MPPEGVVFYKVTLPQNVPAWSLWLNGGNQLIGVRKSKVPVLFTSSAVADRKQSGSLLLVPPYLGRDRTPILSVIGTAASQITLDSRIQPWSPWPLTAWSRRFQSPSHPTSFSGWTYRRGKSYGTWH